MRNAKASGTISLSPDTLNLIKQNLMKKGDVLTVAEIAGIQAAKKTADLIPLCHNIFISSVTIDFEMKDDTNSIQIISTAKTNSVTGIEMEALTGVSVAALTIYDMCKAIDKSIKITDVHLLTKTGGKSGDYNAR